MKIALTVAGSDSGGGAGIQADLKTFQQFGVYGTTVIVALTAQNTLGVDAVHLVPAPMVEAQFTALSRDLPPDALKTGMLATADLVRQVAGIIRVRGWSRYVLDPVMVATSGDRLLAADAVDALRKVLIPRALVITPNLPEAAALVGASPARNEKEMEIQARELLALGARNVLIKGGHGTSDDSVDLLIGQGDVVRLSAKRIATKNLHGTGCTLSSAIAAGLAKGLDLKEASHEAKVYVTGAIAAAGTLKIGHGHGPLHHFYQSGRDA